MQEKKRLHTEQGVKAALCKTDRKIAEAAVVFCGLQGDLPFFWNLPMLSTMNLEHDFFPQS